MKDPIEREDAIKAIEDERIDGTSLCKADNAIYRIRDIPSAEPKQGEWISLHNGKWKCSECGVEVLIYAKGNFCPNCGARMRKGGR